MKKKGGLQKPKEGKSRSSISGSKNKGAARFADQRPEAAIQRKLREGMSEGSLNGQSIQLRASMQAGPEKAPIQGAAKQNGLPNQLKSGIEGLSGYSMEDVKVHYNSSKPAQLQAHAYAQGSEIHLAPGQEKHLPHEAWHVVQQKQGRVQATRQLKGKVAINDDSGLEREADVMGAKALNSGSLDGKAPVQKLAASPIVQRVLDEEEDRKVTKLMQNLDAQITAIDRQMGGPATLRMINADELMNGVDPEVENAFWAFMLGPLPAAANQTEIQAEVVARLKEVFGSEEFEQLMADVFAPADWTNLRFFTKGVKTHMYENFRKYDPKAKRMVKVAGGSNVNTEKAIREGVTAGVDLPDEIKVRKGEQFFKVMPIRSSFLRTYSIYYLSREELDDIVQHQDFADILGLPLTSYAPVYNVFQITALEDTTVYRSTIAPTIQSIANPAAQFENPGGRKQTLILNSNDRKVWHKQEFPVAILDPNETELLAVRRLENGG